jgi:hypothetical protein
MNQLKNRNLLQNFFFAIRAPTIKFSRTGIGIFGSFWLIWLFFFYSMALFLVGVDFFCYENNW